MAIPRRIRRVVAILEVIGVFMSGTLIARLIGGSLGLASRRELTESLRSNNVDFLAMSWRIGGDLLLRYGIVLLLASAVGWWYRRRPLAAYGLTLAGKPLAWHASAAILLFATAGLPAKLLIFLSHHFDLGPGPRHWRLHEGTWTWQFWTYMAVSSFLLVPIVEELFARGYIQTRLSEDFGVAGAIWITAFIFSVSHTQYFIASPLAIGVLMSLLIASVVAGYVRYRAASLLPGMLGHAIGNIPTEGIVEAVVIVMMLFIAVTYRATVMEWMRAMRRDLIVREVAGSLLVALFLITATLVFVLVFRSYLPFLAIGALIVALAAEWRDKQVTPSADYR